MSEMINNPMNISCDAPKYTGSYPVEEDSKEEKKGKKKKGKKWKKLSKSNKRLKEDCNDKAQKIKEYRRKLKHQEALFVERSARQRAELERDLLAWMITQKAKNILPQFDMPMLGQGEEDG